MEHPPKQAFVLRMNHREGLVQKGLEEDEIVIGWAEAPDALLNPGLEWDKFKDILAEAYPDLRDSNRRAGAAAGNMWRFIREMQKGNLVVVPNRPEFYVAAIVGPVTYNPAFIKADTAFRRKVKWLNDKRPIAYNQAPAALYSRLKAYHTCVYGTDLVADIEAVLELALQGKQQDFAEQLRVKLTHAALEQMRHGLMNERAFERLVEIMFRRLGATTKITPRPHDKGDDIVAAFKALDLTIVAQVKYHTNTERKTGPEAIDQVLAGMDQQEALRLGDNSRTILSRCFGRSSKGGGVGAPIAASRRRGIGEDTR